MAADEDRRSPEGEGGLAPVFDPGSIEGIIYGKWMASGAFAAPEHPAPGQQRFSIVMPPPNVTGRLHMGHALDNTLQDVFVRWQRMRGLATLWLPGTDHAGIATQAVVERRLGLEGESRASLGRQRFVERVWEWKREYEEGIVGQLQRLGCSCDWSRQRFTLDPGLSSAVREVFLRYHAQGLIYRGPYIVNWCPGCATAISDLEVEHQEEDSTLYHIAYPVTDSRGQPQGEIVIATVRPETMLGDAAVAVHPDAARYTHLRGGSVRLPLVDRQLPIIADEHVDPSFGTGALKVTPAHDADDYAIGQRHNLPAYAVIGPDGRVLPEWGPVAGLSVDAARVAIVEALEKEGALRGREAYAAAVGRCQRCGGVIEPLISTQWFLRMRTLADAAAAAVEAGEIRFVPEGFGKIFLQWMGGAHDWCISRQLWWGHPIPAYHCPACGEVTLADAVPERCPRCGSIERAPDPDVLDTWFSSALWPFSTLGWPEETSDLAAYYPTDLLVTGRDILFFWVARMVFSGLRLTGAVPFRTVLLHGLVRDAQGRKMSKSLGNGIDPLEVIDRYGADALRLTLLSGVAPGNDLRFAPDRIEGSQRFCNKLWNAARFALEHLDGAPGKPGPAELADRWIESRLARLAADMNTALSAYDTSGAVALLTGFVWEDFCDWYLEAVKSRLHGRHGEASRDRARQTLGRILDGVLRLAHPILPFITEAIWERVPGNGDDLLLCAAYPAAEGFTTDLEAEGGFELLRAVVTSVRSLRAEFGVPPAATVRVHLRGEGAEAVTAGRDLVLELSRARQLIIGEPEDRSASAVVGPGIEVLVPLGDVVDLEQVITRLRRERQSAETERDRTAARLDNPTFRERAKPEVVERDRERLQVLAGKVQSLGERLRQLAVTNC